jgi:formyl-CoA transferase
MFATMDVEPLSERLEAADIAFARVNDVAGFIRHPHLRRISVETPSGPVSYPAPAAIRDQPRQYGPVPSLGEHTEKVRKEFE